MKKALFIFIYLLFYFPAFAVVHNVSTGAALQTALTNAVAGDEIIVANGNYTGKYFIQSNSGTASQPIYLHAANLHQAVFDGPNVDVPTTNDGLYIIRHHWIIEGFEFKEHSSAIDIADAFAANTEIRHNLIHSFFRDGIRFRSNNNKIHHNVIANSPQPSSANAYGAIMGRFDASSNQIYENIIYSMTNDKYISQGGLGDGIGFEGRNDNNLIQGNLIMDCGYTNIKIFSDNSQASSSLNQSSGNIVRDNIIANSISGAIGLSHKQSDFNTVTNNIIKDVFFASWGAKGNIIGQNVYTHNTTIVTDHTLSGGFLDDAFGRDSMDETVKDNIFYSDIANNGSQYLFHIYDYNDTILVSDYNLFWRPGADSGTNTTWNRNYTYGANDIHGTTQPTFVDKAGGDWTLAPGSPGKNAASDGTDMGAVFNSFLKRHWMQFVAAFPTAQQNTSGATSIAFAGTSASHQYQVYSYLPPTSYYTGTENFVIEGQTVSVNMTSATTNSTGANSYYVGAEPRRWIYLGTHPNNGTLNVSFTNANSSNKFYIRRMPTIQESYAMVISLGGAPGGTITVIEPAPGGAVKPGETVSVRWSSENVSNNVQVVASRDGGVSYPEVISASTPVGYQLLNWLVPPGVSSSNCLVKVVSIDNTSVYGTSAAFRIRGRFL